LVDPLSETLEVYRLDSEHWVLLATHGGEDVVRAEPFEVVEIELKRLWGGKRAAHVGARSPNPKLRR
jgi:hypothetical protein